MARVVLFGASNLARCLPTVLGAARARLGHRPLDMLLAFGHGRSYGLRTRFLGRELPSILDCGLWAALARRPPMPTYALVTDIGNDIGYGAPSPRLLEWVEECTSRLEEAGAVTVLTTLPVEGLRSLSSWRIEAVRRLFFPASTLDVATARRRIEEVEAGLCELARRARVARIAPKGEWYGLDPLHIRRRCAAEAWPCLLKPWSEKEATAEAKSGMLEALRLRLAKPEKRSIFGIEQRHPQPSMKWRGGDLSFF